MEHLYYKYKGQEVAVLHLDLDARYGDMYRTTDYINGVYQRSNFWARVTYDSVGPKLVFYAKSGVRAGRVATFTMNETCWRMENGTPLSQDQFLEYIGCVE